MHNTLKRSNSQLNISWYEFDGIRTSLSLSPRDGITTVIVTIFLCSNANRRFIFQNVKYKLRRITTMIETKESNEFTSRFSPMFNPPPSCTPSKRPEFVISGPPILPPPFRSPSSLSLSSPPEGAFNYGGGDALAPRCDRKRGPDVKYDARSNFNYAMQQPWIVATGSFRHIGLIHVIRATLIKPGNAVSLNPPVECKMRLAR